MAYDRTRDIIELPVSSLSGAHTCPSMIESREAAFVVALYMMSVAQQLLRPCPVSLPAEEAETGQWLGVLHLPGVEWSLCCW